MRLKFWKPVTLQQDFYATLSNFLGEYERIVIKKGKITKVERATLMVRWSLMLKNVVLLHLEREDR